MTLRLSIDEDNKVAFVSEHDEEGNVLGDALIIFYDEIAKADKED